MALDEQLAAAFIDGTSGPYSNRRVLGRRLRKFSLWHKFLLRAVDSPFIHGAPATPLDLRIAVGICCLRYGDSRIRKPILWPFWSVLRGILILPWILVCRFKGWKYNPDKFWDTHAERFVVSCDDYLQEPEYTVIPPKRSAASAPECPRGKFDDALETAWLLMERMPEDKAWNMPVGKAKFYIVLLQRSHGVDIDIMTEGEREFQRQMKEAENAGRQCN